MRDPVALSPPDCSQRLVRQRLNKRSREGHLAQKKWPSRPGDPVAGSGKSPVVSLTGELARPLKLKVTAPRLPRPAPVRVASVLIRGSS
jgi:hypothetical protein